jgi:hypothetical protein
VSDELVARLASAEAGVRRVAVHDLIARGDEASLRALAEHLGRERDEKAALLIARHLRKSGFSDAAPALLALYLDPSAPARAAVEAIRAHDELAG